jgi:hypothetical protein
MEFSKKVVTRIPMDPLGLLNVCITTLLQPNRKANRFMKTILIAVLFYFIACPFILAIHGLSPTNMAGPGLDMIVYFLSALFTIALLANSLFKISASNKLSYLNLAINVIGSIIIIVLLCQELTRRN